MTERSALARTSLRRKWVLQTGVFAIVCLVFGVWGYYDATVAYPGRGVRVAEKLELEYLRESDRAQSLERAAITDPGPELARLSARAKQLSPLEQARYEWLRALSLVGRATPEHTTIESPRERLASLEKAWVTKEAPESLSPWDIKVQWLIAACGTAIGLWLVFLLLRAASRKYTWSAAEKRLTLPGGHAITPADIEEFDKRRWDKFFITLRIRASHQTLGGKSVKLDLLRYHPLEEWVLDMEKASGLAPAPAPPKNVPAASSETA